MVGGRRRTPPFSPPTRGSSPSLQSRPGRPFTSSSCKRRFFLSYYDNSPERTMFPPDSFTPDPLGRSRDRGPSTRSRTLKTRTFFLHLRLTSDPVDNEGHYPQKRRLGHLVLGLPIPRVGPGGVNDRDTRTRPTSKVERLVRGQWEQTVSLRFLSLTHVRTVSRRPPVPRRRRRKKREPT